MYKHCVGWGVKLSIQSNVVINRTRKDVCKNARVSLPLIDSLVQWGRRTPVVNWDSKAIRGILFHTERVTIT